MGTDEQDQLAEEFFNSLPHESFTPEEDDLLSVLCNFLDHWDGQGFPTYCIVTADQGVRRARGAALPPEVKLQQWINNRCADVFDVLSDQAGDFCVGYAGTMDRDEVAKQGTAKKAREAERQAEKKN